MRHVLPGTLASRGMALGRARLGGRHAEEGRRVWGFHCFRRVPVV